MNGIFHHISTFESLLEDIYYDGVIDLIFEEVTG